MMTNIGTSAEAREYARSLLRKAANDRHAARAAALSELGRGWAYATVCGYIDNADLT
jgi:hypothetical protein